MSEDEAGELIKCPWCGEDDFDLAGLKFHLEIGYCEQYQSCERPKSYLERLSEMDEGGDEE